VCDLEPGIGTAPRNRDLRQMKFMTACRLPRGAREVKVMSDE